MNSGTDEATLDQAYAMWSSLQDVVYAVLYAAYGTRGFDPLRCSGLTINYMGVECRSGEDLARALNTSVNEERVVGSDGSVSEDAGEGKGPPLPRRRAEASRAQHNTQPVGRRKPFEDTSNATEAELASIANARASLTKEIGVEFSAMYEIDALGRPTDPKRAPERYFRFSAAGNKNDTHVYRSIRTFLPSLREWIISRQKDEGSVSGGTCETKKLRRHPPKGGDVVISSTSESS
jgi:hypothetical protein